MRVLWICDSMSMTQRQVAQGLSRLPDVELEIVGRWAQAPSLDPQPIPLTQLVCRNKVDFRARRVIRDKLISMQPELVFAYTSRNLANTAAACRGIRPLPKLVGYRGTINRLSRLDPANWITFWHPRVTRIACVCDATKRALEASGIPAKKLATVWEGCDPSLFPHTDHTALAEFDIPAGAFVVGTVANMRPVKGVDLLLEAARQLHDLEIYWLLIGDVRDPRVPKLAADPRIADRVRLPGGRPAGGRYAGLFSIYVAPSRMEGLSMGIMEAMAQGTCPVVTNVGGSPELIRHEVDGLVVPPENPAALAGAIRRLYGDPAARERMADSARRRCQTEFSIESWTRRHYELYRDLLGATVARAA